MLDDFYKDEVFMKQSTLIMEKILELKLKPTPTQEEHPEDSGVITFRRKAEVELAPILALGVGDFDRNSILNQLNKHLR